MSLAIFKGTYLLGELTLHERASEMGRRLKHVSKLPLKCRTMYSIIQHIITSVQGTVKLPNAL